MKGQQPLISVIMPCYNVASFLDVCMQSLLNQTYTNLEIVCLNDCSTDDTLKILEFYAQKDERIKVYSNDSNKGLVFTLNKLVSLANSEIMVRMDSDDICTPNRIEILYDTFIKSRADLVSSNYFLIDECGKTLPKRGFTLLATPLGIKYTAVFNSPFPHPQSLIIKKIFHTYSYDENYKAAEDYKLWTQLLLDQDFKGVIVNENIYGYRVNQLGMSMSNNDLQVENHIKIAKHYLSQLLDLDSEKFDFWGLSKKAYDYKSKTGSEIKESLFQITKIRKWFVGKFPMTIEEKKEINQYEAQYLLFTYFCVLRDAKIQKQIGKVLPIVIKNSMVNLPKFLNIKVILWLFRNI